MTSHSYTVTDSELVLDCPIIGVRRDMVTMPQGNLAAREIVEHFGAVAVVAVDERGRIPLVRQWRQCVKKRLWELPAGILDIAGEDELDTAKRELLEEAGLAADDWSVLVDLVTSPGFCEEAVRVYLARDLHPVDRPAGRDEEAELELHWFDASTIHAMLTGGQINNSIAVAGLFRALDVLAGRSGPLPLDTPFSLRPSSMANRRAPIVGAGHDMKHPHTTAR